MNDPLLTERREFSAAVGSQCVKEHGDPPGPGLLAVAGLRCAVNDPDQVSAGVIA